MKVLLDEELKGTEEFEVMILKKPEKSRSADRRVGLHRPNMLLWTSL
jgi:hypothetical protein